jgi:ankyrin repeat protein
MIDSPECVDLLIKAGLNLNAQDQRGNTPAMVACFFNKPNILKSLIAAKADLTLKNNEGKDVNAICDERDVDECKAVLQAK